MRNYTSFIYNVICVLLLLMGFSAVAQDKQADCPPEGYELGVALGRNQYFGDMHCSAPYASTGFNMNIQGFVRRQLSPGISLRGNLLVGGLAANDLDNPAGRWNYRKASFSSSLFEVAALLEVYPFGRKRGWSGKFG